MHDYVSVRCALYCVKEKMMGWLQKYSGQRNYIGISPLGCPVLKDILRRVFLGCPKGCTPVCPVGCFLRCLPGMSSKVSFGVFFFRVSSDDVSFWIYSVVSSGVSFGFYSGLTSMISSGIPSFLVPSGMFSKVSTGLSSKECPSGCHLGCPLE